MRFYQYGQIVGNAIDQNIEIQPIKFAQNDVLKRLNFLLKFVKERYPQEINPFINNLLDCYTGKSAEDSLAEFSIDLDQVMKGMDFLIENRKLTSAYLNCYFQLLNMASSYNSLEDKTEVKSGDHYRSFLMLRYCNLDVLSKTLGRKVAINIFKQFSSYFSKENPVEGFEVTTIENLEKEWLEISKNSKSNWSKTFGIIGNGKFAYKSNNCLWVDAVTELEDIEFKYLVCCYQDFQNSKSYYADHIILTMEHTIAKGDLYCSCLLHDTLVDWDLRHPPKEFWDDMEPS